MVRTCKNCGKELVIIATTSPKKMFCDAICRNNWYYHNDKKYHDRLLKTCKEYYWKNKHDPAFRKKNYERVKRWIGEHREHFNELCRKYYQRKKEKNEIQK